MANNTNRNKGRQTQSRQSQSRAAAEREALKKGKKTREYQQNRWCFTFCCFCYFLFYSGYQRRGLVEFIT